MKNKEHSSCLTVVGIILILSLVIIACNGMTSRESINYSQAWVGRFGPNDDLEKHFVFTNGYDGHYVGNIITLYDVDAQDSKVIYCAKEQEKVNYLSTSNDGLVNFLVENDNEELLFSYNISSGVLEKKEYIKPAGQNYDSSKIEAEITTSDKGAIHFTKTISDSKYFCAMDDETFELNGVGGSAFNKSGIYSSDLIHEDGTVFIRLTAIIGIGHGPQGIPFYNDSYNDQIKKDVLYLFDSDTKECSLIYDTKGSSTRIVGYKNGVVYLFGKNTLSKYDTNSKTFENIKRFDNGHKLIFYWYGNDLLVFDATTKEVLTVIRDC